MVVSWLQYILYIVSKNFWNPKWKFDKFLLVFRKVICRFYVEILFEVYYLLLVKSSSLAVYQMVTLLCQFQIQKRNYQFGDNGITPNELIRNQPANPKWTIEKNIWRLTLVLDGFLVANTPKVDPPGITPTGNCLMKNDWSPVTPTPGHVPGPLRNNKGERRWP